MLLFSDTTGVQLPTSSVFTSSGPLMFVLGVGDSLLFLSLVMFLISSRGVEGSLALFVLATIALKHAG